MTWMAPHNMPTARATPIVATMSISMMKGIRIVQLLAPTSRMMLISASDEGRLPDRRRHEERGTDRHERRARAQKTVTPLMIWKNF